MAYYATSRVAYQAETTTMPTRNVVLRNGLAVQSVLSWASPSVSIICAIAGNVPPH